MRHTHLHHDHSKTWDTFVSAFHEKLSSLVEKRDYEDFLQHLQVVSILENKVIFSVDSVRCYTYIPIYFSGVIQECLPILQQGVKDFELILKRVGGSSFRMGIPLAQNDASSKTTC